MHEAVRAYALLVAGSRSSSVWWEYGTTLAALEDHRAAVAAFDRALAVDSRMDKAWNDRGVALVALQRDDEARESFERALTQAGYGSAAAGNLANLLVASGDLQRAEALYRHALREDMGNVQSRIGLGRLLMRDGRHAEAAQELDRACRRAPYDFDALLAQVCFRLASGALEQANEACARFLSLSPFHSGALGLRAELDREQGGTEHSELLNVVDWVRVLDLDLAPSLLGGLVEALSSHSTLCHAPPHHATREGWHSGALDASHHDALAALEPLLENALQNYHPPSHARLWWSESRPRAVAVQSWAVSLGGQGFQLPHLHPRGWLSGVVYVEVPEHVQHDAESHRGCLELGRPDPELGLRAPRTSHFVRPRPGRLVLFPSWLYHSTVPHAGVGQRLSVAFDCVRAG